MTVDDVSALSPRHVHRWCNNRGSIWDCPARRCPRFCCRQPQPALSPSGRLDLCIMGATPPPHLHGGGQVCAECSQLHPARVGSGQRLCATSARHGTRYGVVKPATHGQQHRASAGRVVPATPRACPSGGLLYMKLYKNCSVKPMALPDTIYYTSCQ